MFAFVTLVMLGDRYVAGAMVLAKSLLMTGTVHDLVCMVTSDVSESAVAKLKTYYRIKRVEYVRRKCPRMLTKRQNQLYGDWISCSFTKWQCLNMTEYEKIVYLDADHLVVKNIDHLFASKSAVSVSFWSEYYSCYDNLSRGDIVTFHRMIKFMKYNRVLCKTGTVVLTPSKVLFDAIQNSIKTSKCFSVATNRYHNGFDEQIFVQALIDLRMSVEQLSPMYAWNAGAYFRLRKNTEPFVINYYGDRKPWYDDDENNTTSVRYMDVYIWKYFNLLVKDDTKIRART
ncbi:P13 protein [Spodoptera littoralis nucleopolyhedrovirus]|uniref:P13 protein n=1 Tax=Spodoptera littoralis nuclear polyhedrosis virus TaxID=10456 RepID=M1J4C3_NPVSL|nr:P13 protein [Spodoptera littoralis nucleopolyhedrovirus]AGE89949.1 P13 protein [Spodoptera littoralis nucleopolyhedrovirus]AYU75283.1 P13 protein [Spodoptera littoralis nucleopolyhedrovirus]